MPISVNTTRWTYNGDMENSLKDFYVTNQTEGEKLEFQLKYRGAKCNLLKYLEPYISVRMHIDK